MYGKAIIEYSDLLIAYDIFEFLKEFTVLVLIQVPFLDGIRKQSLLIDAHDHCVILLESIEMVGLNILTGQ